jgi:hypothetical protein
MEGEPSLLRERYPGYPTTATMLFFMQKQGVNLIRARKIDESAQISKSGKRGGIDFTANRTPLEIQNSGEGIKFHMDAAMLQQLQNAPGFVPVIINIQPLKNLQQFLGVNSTVPIVQPSSP